jgi:hypothetical protein
LNPGTHNRKFAFRYTLIIGTSSSTGQTHVSLYQSLLSYDSVQFGRDANISEDLLFTACYRTSKTEAAVYSEEMLCIQQSTRRHVKVIRNLETSVRTASLMCLVLDYDKKNYGCLRHNVLPLLQTNVVIQQLHIDNCCSLTLYNHDDLSVSVTT